MSTINKKLLTVFIIICVLLIGGLCYLGLNLRQQRKANADMQQLAELDKKEMENEYQQFSDQYSEMKTHVTNDSLISQLSAEQEKTQRLLAELKRTKSSDAREIARLKRELATVRAVLRSYVIQIDSLNQANGRLTAENTRVKGQYEEATRQIEGLNTEKASLSEQVAIASQLDANGIQMHLLNKNNKAKDKISKARTIQVNFNIAKNVTARTGMKTVLRTHPLASRQHHRWQCQFPIREQDIDRHNEESDRVQRQRDPSFLVCACHPDAECWYLSGERLC